MTNGATIRRGFANLGNGGERITDWLTLAPLWVDPYYDSARPKNICFIWCGTNDGGGAGAYADVKTLCAARKAVGWTVVVVDLLPKGTDPSFETARQTFNSSLAADFTSTYATRVKTVSPYADYLIQVGSDPTIGVAGSQNNTTYFNLDRTHLTDAGYAIPAAYGKTVMGAIGYT